MKKTNIVLIFLLLFLNIDSYAEKTDTSTPNNSTSSINLLVQESISFIKKNAWIVALTPIAVYHHKDITDFITDHPYSSSFIFYIGLHYICDSIANYQEQQTLLEIIFSLKKTALYLIICHGLKNYIHNKNLSFHPFLNEHDFLNSITANLAYDFDELSVITLKSYQELKLFLQSLNMELTIESEEFVFLCHASSITLQSSLYLVQNDDNLYQKIYQFEKNPEVNCKPLMEYLTSEITQTFCKLEQQLLASNIPSEIV